MNEYKMAILLAHLCYSTLYRYAFMGWIYCTLVQPEYGIFPKNEPIVPRCRNLNIND